MLIGVPKEIKNHEYRVGLTPESVAELVDDGNVVLVETNAALKEAQAEKLAAYQPTWVEHFSEIEPVGPVLIVGNEFLDVLPTARFAVAAKRCARTLGCEG